MTTDDYRWLRKMVDVMMKSGLYKKDEVHDVLLKLATYKTDPMGLGMKMMGIIAGYEESHMNLAQEVEDWIMTTDGTFSTTDIYSGLQLTSRAEKKNAVVILIRLEKKGMITKTGKRAGQYRRLDDSFTALTDFESEDTIPVSLKFPLQLEQYANIYQSNIICIAGEKDTGKTGFCLSFASMNRGNGHKVRYISSEFGAAELKSRLLPMDLDPDLWIKQVEFGQFQRNNVQDAIAPDAINIVDFLESDSGEFFMVSEQIKQIYQKLRSGVALIALQKKIGSEYARGGELSAEKARLYVTLSRVSGPAGMKNIATILHCKNRAIPEVNANGLSCEYKLGGGHYFKKTDIWMPR